MPGKRSAMRNGKKVSGSIGNGIAPNRAARSKGSKAGSIVVSRYSTVIKVGQLAKAGVTIKELKGISAPQSLITAYERHLKRLLAKR